jgi:hypothetical protein
MTHELTSQSNLESLRKEAKRWFKAIQAGARQAIDRLTRIDHDHPTPTLRVVQHTMALEYGFPNWAAMKSWRTGLSPAAATPSGSRCSWISTSVFGD